MLAEVKREAFLYCREGIYIQFVMTQTMKITYQCNMNFTQSIQCFQNIYILNTILATLHDYAVMLLLSICEHLSVHWKMEQYL